MATAKRFPNEFQTILEHGTRPDIERAEIRRAQIEAHIGRYLSRWAHLEASLGIATAAWLGGDDPKNSQHVMLLQSTSYKINRFKEALPEDWNHGKLLVQALYQGNTYRDSLAHWSLAMGGYNDGKAHGWSLWKMSKVVRVKEISDALMREMDMKARILNEAATAVMGDPFLLPDRSPMDPNLSLAPSILNMPGTWATDEEFRDHGRAVKKMFP